MDKTPPVAKSSAALQEHLVDKELAGLHVYGINSLKTIDPPLSDLANDRVVNVVVDEQRRHVEIELVRHVIAIDLARTGTAVLLATTKPWTPADGAAMPTARFILRDGTGVDLREPAKTKRITVTVARK